MVSKHEIETLIRKVGMEWRDGMEKALAQGPCPGTMNISQKIVDSSITHILCRGGAMMCETFL